MTERMIAVKGPMFSRKTLELIQIADQEQYAGLNVQIFKPHIDDRGEGNNKIKSRFGGEWEATPIKSSTEILSNLKKGTHVVIVDEVQFIQDKDRDGNFMICRVFQYLVNKDIKVVFAGLPRDFRGMPFGPMKELLALVQETRELFAVCDHVLDDGNKCRQQATETQRFVNGNPAHWDDPIILVGDKEEGYAARCVNHHVVKGKPSSSF